VNKVNDARSMATVNMLWTRKSNILSRCGNLCTASFIIPEIICRATKSLNIFNPTIPLNLKTGSRSRVPLYRPI